MLIGFAIVRSYGNWMGREQASRQLIPSIEHQVSLLRSSPSFGSVLNS